MTFYLIYDNNNVCSISHIYQIFTNQIKYQQSDLENEGQDQEEKLVMCHSIINVRFYIADYFCYLKTYVYLSTLLNSYKPERILPSSDITTNQNGDWHLCILLCSIQVFEQFADGCNLDKFIRQLPLQA